MTVKQICIRVLSAAALVCLAAGCTYVRVRPGSDPAAEGFRYYLPQPYLYVTRTPDGGISNVETKVLPDLSRPYYVHTRTIAANHTLAVEVSDAGLLTKFGSNADSTAVPVHALGEVGKYLNAVTAAELERRKADAADAADAATTPSKTTKRKGVPIPPFELLAIRSSPSCVAVCPVPEFPSPCAPAPPPDISDLDVTPTGGKDAAPQQAPVEPIPDVLK